MSCQHGNNTQACDLCDALDAEYQSGYASAMRKQQATIERLTDQRDRLLGCIKAQNEREKEYLAVMHKLPRNYYFTNQSDALIAEIEANK